MLRTAIILIALITALGCSTPGGSTAGSTDTSTDFSIQISKQRSMIVRQSFPATPEEVIKFVMVDPEYRRNLSDLEFRTFKGDPLGYRELSPSEWEVRTQRQGFVLTYKVISVLNES